MSRRWLAIPNPVAPTSPSMRKWRKIYRSCVVRINVLYCRQMTVSSSPEPVPGGMSAGHVELKRYAGDALMLPPSTACSYPYLIGWQPIQRDLVRA